MAEAAEENLAEQTPEELNENLNLPSDLTAVLKDRYLIDGDQPLTNLDSPNAHAYEVTDPRDLELKLFALVCNPRMPVRIDAMIKLKSAAPKGLLPLIDWDTIDWPLFGQKTIAIIYERPKGGRLTDALSSGATRISEYDIINRILTPAITGILTLSTNEISHRAIRPDNMFFMDDRFEDLVLGECVTTLPGYDQPTVYETIERCTADLTGRGRGSSLDDIYALGISLMFILLGHNPVQNVSELDILAEKIERGTYAAISTNNRVPLPAIELLRGLLTDDDEARWTPEITEIWIDGRKNTPVQRRGSIKAKTAYIFQGRPHLNPRTLAYAFSKAPDEAYRTIKADENFESWLRRGVEDRELADKARGIIEMSSSGKGGVQQSVEVVIAKVCILLDPSGPIRYKDRAFMTEAFGTSLAYDFAHETSPQNLLEVINRDLHEFWFKNQLSSTPDHALWQRQLMRCKGYLKVNEHGFGAERCLYELNRRIPCLSPLIIDDFITEIDTLLPAIDAAASRAEQDSRPVDRHIAGFIGARFNEDIHPHLRAMALPEPERSIIGVLSLLAFLQWKMKTAPVYGLSSWLGGLLGPSISTYHNRKTRRDLEREIPQLVRKGSLPELFDLVDNIDQRKEDEDGFQEARKEYMAADAEIEEMEGKDGSRETNLMRSGHKAAAMTSIIIAMLTIFALFLLEDWN